MGITISSEQLSRHEVLLLKDAVQTFQLRRSQEYPIVISLFDGTKDRLTFAEMESNKKNGHRGSLSELLDDFSDEDFTSNAIFFLLRGTEASAETSVQINLSERFVKKLRGTLVQPMVSIHGQFNSEPEAPFSFCTSSIKLASEVTKRGSFSEGGSELKSLFNNSRNMQWNREVQIKYSVVLSWKRFGVDLDKAPPSVLDKLFKEKILTDCVIIASNKTEASCHRNIVAAQSDVLYAMLTNGLKESQTNVIEMTDVSEEAVQVLVSLFYQNDVHQAELGEMSEELVLELLQTVHKYNISSLDDLFVNLICSQSDRIFSTGSALHCYLFTSKIEAYRVIRLKMIGILERNAAQLRSSEASQEFMDKNPTEAMELALILIEKLASK